MSLTTFLHSHDDIPSKMSSTRHNLPWVDRSIRRVIRRKKRLYKKARKSGSPATWNKFKSLRRSIDRKIKKAHKNYIHDVIGGSLKSENSKPFWNYIKTKSQEVFGISTLSTQGRTVSLAADKAEALNDQFCSVFTNENTNDMPTLQTKNIPDIDKLVITMNGVQKLLADIQPKKAMGPDQIPAKILKSCSESLAPVFQKIFQKSIDIGSLPQDWRKANIVPIYKKGDRTNPANYRPVSLTSIPCKLLEHIIHHHIMEHLDLHRVLTNRQHGFRRGRSCDTQLAGLIDDLAKILDAKSQADLVILDFSKAFDTVPHQRLLSKLKNIGINNSLLEWIKIFLTTRLQKVLLDGETSTESQVTSGVPQGTVLGPLLFLIYINDLPDAVSSDVRLFADDCIMYKEIKTAKDQDALQNGIDSLCKWEKSWQMSFNSTKCYTMHVTHKTNILTRDYNMNGNVLETVKHHPYLGVEISNDLSWAQHIKQTSNKANKMLGLLRRNIHSCSKDVKDIAYKTLVRSKLEYCGGIWDPYYENNKSTMEKVQRRAARFVMNNYKKRESVTNMLSDLNWETLEERRTKLRLIAIYKEAHGITPSNIKIKINKGVNTRSSSGNYIITEPPFKKKCYQYSMYPRTIREWNFLPPDVQATPDLLAFKTSLDSINIQELVQKAHFGN